MVLPSLNDLVIIRRKIGLSSAKMSKVKARLLTKYLSLMRLLWNRSQNMLKKIFFLLAFYRRRKKRKTGLQILPERSGHGEACM